MSFETKPRALDVHAGQPLGDDPVTVAGRRFRASADIEVVVHNVTVERILRRRAESLRTLTDGADEELVLWLTRPVPAEEEMRAARELIAAALADPGTLDRILHVEILDCIRDGSLDGVGSPPLDSPELRPLIDRLPEHHRNALLRTSPDEHWSDRIWDLRDSFEEEAVSISVVSVRG